ncbi:TetR/AcrR family transcriptional regulator [Reyranella sp.]|uniref:TetR/AcrR family transcriptional regulator n=1 Tax=Reyranella sp. TaxID=1929291 RepID=UPI003BAA8E69
MEMPPPASPVHGDGRRRRSERTRQTIIEAFLSLLRERADIPTAAQIASRAGISTRSVFERFDDLQTLAIAAVDHAFAQGESLAIARNVDGQRHERIRTHVETRAQTCERWLPLWRVAVANQARLDELQIRLRFMRQVVIRRIELMYAPELTSVGEMHRQDLLIGIDALIDFESWGRLREFYGFSVEDGVGLWIRTIDRMLPPTPVASAVQP